MKPTAAIVATSSQRTLKGIERFPAHPSQKSKFSHLCPCFLCVAPVSIVPVALAFRTATASAVHPANRESSNGWRLTPAPRPLRPGTAPGR